MTKKRKPPARPHEWEESSMVEGSEFPPTDWVSYQIDPDPSHVEGALHYDLAAIQNRLKAVNEVFAQLEHLPRVLEKVDPEVAANMTEYISWGKDQLESASWRIDALIRGLADDARVGAKQRPAWSEGGQIGAKSRCGKHAERDEAIKAGFAELKKKRPDLSDNSCYAELSKKYPLSKKQISRIVKK